MDLISALKQSRRIRSGSGVLILENDNTFNDNGKSVPITGLMLMCEDWEPLSPNKRVIRKEFKNCLLGGYTEEEKSIGIAIIYKEDGCDISASLPMNRHIKITAEWEEWQEE